MLRLKFQGRNLWTKVYQDQKELYSIIRDPIWRGHVEWNKTRRQIKWMCRKRFSLLIDSPENPCLFLKTLWTENLPKILSWIFETAFNLHVLETAFNLHVLETAFNLIVMENWKLKHLTTIPIQGMILIFFKNSL